MGPCAKQRVICVIHVKNHEPIVGENVCLTPQTACPRLPGEGYAKCYTVCSQIGHAEEVALRQFRNAGLDPQDVTAVVGLGHVGPCAACRSQLDSMGLLGVTMFDPDAPTVVLSQQTCAKIDEAYHLGDAQTHQALDP